MKSLNNLISGGVDKSSTGTHQRVPGLLHLPSKTSSALTGLLKFCYFLVLPTLWLIN